MRLYTCTISFLILLMTGCSGGDSPEYDHSIKPAGTTNTAPAAVEIPAAPADPTVQMVAPTPVTTGSSNLNPPHGEPGHRCDIAVGAPLDSKPAAPVVTQAAPANAPVQVTPVTAPPVMTAAEIVPEAQKTGEADAKPENKPSEEKIAEADKSQR